MQSTLVAQLCATQASASHALQSSSTEAEIIAASACALELVSAITVREELGFESTGPIVLFVDNDGAVELSRDRKSCHRARHVDRRYFKVRELVAKWASACPTR